MVHIKCTWQTSCAGRVGALWEHGGLTGLGTEKESQNGKEWRAQMQEGTLVITEYITESTVWSAGCQQYPQTWVMGWNKHKIEYASLRRFTSTHSKQNGTGGFIATIFFSFNNLGFNLACSKCVVLKVRMSVCGIVRLTSSHFLSERRKKASGWEKNLLYPIVMLILLAGTVHVWDQLTESLLFTAVPHAAWLVAARTNPQLLQVFFFFFQASGCGNDF